MHFQHNNARAASVVLGLSGAVGAVTSDTHMLCVY